MQIAAYISLGISAIVLILSLINPGFNILRSFNLEPNLASQFGSYVGGILGPLLSVTSILLLLATIRSQRHDRLTDEIKNHALELLKYNRNTVEDFEYVISWDKNGETHSGSRFFVFAKRQIEEAIESVGVLYPAFDLLKRSQIGYLIAYYGFGKESIGTLRSRLLALVDDEVSLHLIAHFSKKKTEYSDKILAYGGHQSRLSSYFRQLFYLIGQVHADKTLSQSEKTNLIKLVRVQMNDYEQAVFYYNTLTALGQPWTRLDIKGKNLVVRYELVKNLQDGFIKGFPPKDQYRDIEFEFA